MAPTAFHREISRSFNLPATMNTLRYYQEAALYAALGALEAGNNPVLQMATGSGKSPVLALLARSLEKQGARVWVVTHLQNLVKQNYTTHVKWTTRVPGLHCSSLGKPTSAPVTYGSVQSMVPALLRGELEPPDYILVDEVHRVPPPTALGQYGVLFARCPAARRAGLSASPWRTDDGLVYGPKEEHFWFDSLAYTYTARQGIADGFLTPVVAVETEHKLDLDPELYDENLMAKEADRQTDTAWMTAMAQSVKQLAASRKYIAVYVSSLAAAWRASNALSIAGLNSNILCGTDPAMLRDNTLAAWKEGRFRCVVSVDTLHTGFDFPELDCLVCLRPTESSNLWVQMLGRLTRVAEGKKNGLALDFVGNFMRLGGVDTVETYWRERGGAADSEITAVPREKKPGPARLPGVIGLIPVDPNTGRSVEPGAALRVKVINSSVVPLQSKRFNSQYLMRSFECVSEDGARVTAADFLECEAPLGTKDNEQAQEKLVLWGSSTPLPQPASRLRWQAKSWPLPSHLSVRKQGKYWNVTAYHFETKEESTE